MRLGKKTNRELIDDLLRVCSVCDSFRSEWIEEHEGSVFWCSERREPISYPACVNCRKWRTSK